MGGGGVCEALKALENAMRPSAVACSLRWILGCTAATRIIGPGGAAWSTKAPPMCAGATRERRSCCAPCALKHNSSQCDASEHHHKCHTVFAGDGRELEQGEVAMLGVRECPPGEGEKSRMGSYVIQ